MQFLIDSESSKSSDFMRMQEPIGELDVNGGSTALTVKPEQL